VERLLVLVVLVGLAGCAAQPPIDGAAHGGVQPEGSGSGTASILLVVVDEAIRPLAEAKVTLDDTGGTATSGADGVVRFVLLEARDYLVLVEKPGYLPVRTTLAAVRDPEHVPIVLSAQAATLPYVQATKQEFYVYAAYHAGVDGVGALVGVTVIEGQAIDLPDGLPAWLQSEAFWEPRQPLGDRLQIRFWVCQPAVDGAVGICDTVDGNPGTSPVYVATPGKALADMGYVEDGDVASEVDPEYPSPAGLTVVADQPVDIITHAFYGFEPLAGWRFSSDGAPVVPA
jgi:hypothetical protein